MAGWLGGWLGGWLAGWLAGWFSDYRATTSSAKSLSVRTSVAIYEVYLQLVFLVGVRVKG